MIEWWNGGELTEKEKEKRRIETQTDRSRGKSRPRHSRNQRRRRPAGFRLLQRKPVLHQGLTDGTEAGSLGYDAGSLGTCLIRGAEGWVSRDIGRIVDDEVTDLLLQSGHLQDLLVMGFGKSG